MKEDIKHAYRSGVENVYLANGFERIDAPYGAAYQYKDSVQLDEAVCASVVQKPGRLNASEIQYLRLRADWRQEDLAQKLHVSAQTVSLWERGQIRIPGSSDLLFRMRFVEEAPKNRRPKLKKRTLWQEFDAHVRKICDFFFVGRWNNGWSFAYEPKGASFVSMNETLIDAILENIETSVLRGEIARNIPIERTFVESAYSNAWTKPEVHFTSPKTKCAIWFKSGEDTDVTISPEHPSLIATKKKIRTYTEFGRKIDSYLKVEKTH